ncbi:hypothetical protein HDU98_004460, partial [Podochytrium sp. JEL0797]
MYNHKRPKSSTSAPDGTPSVLSHFRRQGTPVDAAPPPPPSSSSSWAPALARDLSLASSGTAAARPPPRSAMRAKAADAEAAFLGAYPKAASSSSSSSFAATNKKRALPHEFAASSHSAHAAPAHSNNFSASNSNAHATRPFSNETIRHSEYNPAPYSPLSALANTKSAMPQQRVKKEYTNTQQNNNYPSAPINASRVSLEPGITLTNEQQQVLELVGQGQSLFYTGSAGTGKSVLMRQIIKVLKVSIPSGQIAITAPTEPVPALVKKLQANRKAIMRWKSVKVLIIDE